MGYERMEVEDVPHVNKVATVEVPAFGVETERTVAV
jgi:hypothetical protein